MSVPRVNHGSLLVAALLAASWCQAQSLGKPSLNGKYFFRHVSLKTDTSGNLTDAQSILGTLTFDGAGHYTFSGQLVAGAAAAISQSGNGSYTVDPAGFLSLDSPIRAGQKINARYGPEALVGSSTEPIGGVFDNLFDLFVAIPAPTAAAAQTLLGSYNTATLEFPGGVFNNVRNTLFNLTSPGAGTFSNFNVSGHSASLSNGQPLTQPVTGATYTLASDGTATASFGTSNLSSLLSGGKTIYLSNDGNLLLGGSTAAGSHDILIGVKTLSGATNGSWTNNFWGAGLRQDSTAVTGYAGSVINGGTGVSGGPGTLIWTRRLKVLGVGNIDFTGVNSYALTADGSGTSQLADVALGAGGAAFIGSNINALDPFGFELYFGVQMPAVSGSGLWINPQGVINPTSFSPTGNPLPPGGFIRLYASGLPQTAQAATSLPYPPTLDGVTVLVNNQPAPIYAVTPVSVDFLVPFATTGPTATIAIQRGGATSNTVTVPVAATAPGVLTIAQNGSGPAILQHANYVQITPTSPAAGGETIIIYLTGLGAVTPAVSDGFGGSANPVSTTVQQPTVLIGGQAATVIFSGLTAYPGLYQINAVVPPVPPGVTSLPLAISTANAYHDQVDLPVNP